MKKTSFEVLARASVSTGGSNVCWLGLVAFQLWRTLAEVSPAISELVVHKVLFKFWVFGC